MNSHKQFDFWFWLITFKFETTSVSSYFRFELLIADYENESGTEH